MLAGSGPRTSTSATLQAADAATLACLRCPFQCIDVELPVPRHRTLRLGDSAWRLRRFVHVNRKRVYFSEPFNALYRSNPERALCIATHRTLSCCKDRTCSSFCSASRRLSASNMCHLSEADMIYTITTTSIRK